VAYYDDLMAQQDDFLHTMAARADALLAVPSAQQRFLEENTISLPSAGDATAATNESGTIYRVADSYYFVPVAGCMWEMVPVGTDGMAVTEDYVTGPSPADGIAITP
jgi:hypothetical protein